MEVLACARCGAHLSDGEPGAIVVAPGDTRNTRLVPEKRGGACCGLDGADGPTMVCATCGLPVASRIDDCSLWQAVWFTPTAVHRLVIDGVDARPLSWEELMAQEDGTPPFETITGWGGRGSYRARSPRWEAAAGRALAHLLVASNGERVVVPGGPGPLRAGSPRCIRCRCRSGCGGRWPSPCRTDPFAPRPSFRTATTHAPITRSAPTRTRSTTRWPGYRPSAADASASCSTVPGHSQSFSG